MGRMEYIRRVGLCPFALREQPATIRGLREALQPVLKGDCFRMLPPQGLTTPVRPANVGDAAAMAIIASLTYDTSASGPGTLRSLRQLCEYHALGCAACRIVSIRYQNERT